MDARRAGVVLGVVVLVGIGVLMWLRPEVGEGEREGAARADHAPALASRPVETSRQRAGARRAETRSREEIETLRRTIEEARRRRVETPEQGGPASTPAAVASSGGAAAAPREDDDARLGTLDPSYIRSAVRDVAPLLGECYELALDAARRAGSDAPEGRLVARFVIGGEPDVGGVIEESEVMDESTLRDPVLEECFTETLRTIELPAPDEGGRVTVHYPFELRPEDEAAQE